jgi:hypothetical protein
MWQGLIPLVEIRDRRDGCPQGLEHLPISTFRPVRLGIIRRCTRDLSRKADVAQTHAGPRGPADRPRVERAGRALLRRAAQAVVVFLTLAAEIADAVEACVADAVRRVVGASRRGGKQRALVLHVNEAVGVGLTVLALVLSGHAREHRTTKNHQCQSSRC